MTEKYRSAYYPLFRFRLDWAQRFEEVISYSRVDEEKTYILQNCGPPQTRRGLVSNSWRHDWKYKPETKVTSWTTVIVV